jgi:hypothetical protein
MYRKAASSSVLSLTILRSTALVPDVLLTDPVVRLHVVHAGTGEYVRMVHQAAVGSALEQQTQQQQQQQQGVFGAAAASCDGGVSSGSVPGLMRHVVEPSLQAEVSHMNNNSAICAWFDQVVSICSSSCQVDAWLVAACGGGS